MPIDNLHILDSIMEIHRSTIAVYQAVIQSTTAWYII